MLIDPTKLSQRELSRMVISCVVPRPIALVTSVSEHGVVNAAPFSFFNAVSTAPPVLMIAVDRKSGARKDTSSNILVSKEFVVHIVSEEIAQQMNLTSSNLPPDQSEIPLAGFTLLKSEKLATPRIAESPIQMECILVRHVEIGTNPTDVLFGEVVAFHLRDEIVLDGKVDPASLRAVGRMGGITYSRTRDLFDMVRPK